VAQIDAAVDALATEVTLLSRSATATGPDGIRCCAVGIETGLKPRALLDLCFAIEHKLGRDARSVWGPRKIDIDLLVYEDFVIRSSRLTLPHPYAHHRPYVLEPLREIAPDVADWVVMRSEAPQ
jgi:2-amino-4-hydroxy-6-hydroxymethyldihydropteridine diphosphokinase